MSEVPRLKIKAKTTGGRGSVNFATVVEAMMEVWDELKEAIEDLPEEEQKALRDYFNNFIENEDDLGDILFGTPENFDARVKFLDEAVAKKYTDEIKAKELIVIEDDD